MEAVKAEWDGERARVTALVDELQTVCEALAKATRPRGIWPFRRPG
jgi:hypothetical protein